MALSISALGIQKVNYTLIQFLLTKGDVSLSINFHQILEGHCFF